MVYLRMKAFFCYSLDFAWKIGRLRTRRPFFLSSFFLTLHLIGGGKLDVCGREVHLRSENLVKPHFTSYYNFCLFIENVTLVCLDYYLDYHFSNLDYFRYFCCDSRLFYL